MNQKAKIEFELLLMLITVVFTSAVIFTLVRASIIQVKESSEEVSLLNTEFLPFGRGGTLVIKEFSFCQKVDERYQCLEPKETFKRGEEVHFRFVVESSTYEGEVRLVENYRVTGPDNQVRLEVNEKNNFYFDLNSNKDKEQIYFKDYFKVGYDLVPGEYVLDLLMENPLLDKRVTLSQRLVLE